MNIFGYIGLLMIVAGWVIQFATVSRKDQSLNPSFLILYSIGVLILVADSLNSRQITVALLNLAAAVLPVAILYKISR